MLFKFNEHFFKKSIDLNLSSFFFLSEMDYFFRHKHFLEEKEVFSKDEISFSEIFASEVKKMGTCEESEVICFLLDRYESTCNFIDFSFLTPGQRKALSSVRHLFLDISNEYLNNDVRFLQKIYKKSKKIVEEYGFFPVFGSTFKKWEIQVCTKFEKCVSVCWK